MTARGAQAQFLRRC